MGPTWVQRYGKIVHIANNKPQKLPFCLYPTFLYLPLRPQLYGGDAFSIEKGIWLHAKAVPATVSIGL
jgi:hypothetical protein